MGEDTTARRRVERVVALVRELISEGNHAMAVALLFHLHKNHIEEWVSVKRDLLKTTRTYYNLSVMTELLYCSKKRTLSESAHLFPGLSDLLNSEIVTELLD